MKIIAVLLISGLTACAGYTPVEYSHPKLGATFLKKDQQSCQYESLKTAQVADPRYGVMYGQFDLESRRHLMQRMCMEEKGYNVAE